MKTDYEFLKSKGVDTGQDYVTLKGTPIIQKTSNSTISIGKGVTIVSDSIYNCAGINHPTILSTMHEGAVLTIGDGSGISGASISCYKNITLKRGVGIGVNVCIYDHDFHSIVPYLRCSQENIESAPVIVDEYAWIGGNSIILKGVHIGRAAVIGAGSVVTTDVPELCVYAGNPARFIKKIEVDAKQYEQMFQKQ